MTLLSAYRSLHGQRLALLCFSHLALERRHPLLGFSDGFAGPAGRQCRHRGSGARSRRSGILHVRALHSLAWMRWAFRSRNSKKRCPEFQRAVAPSGGRGRSEAGLVSSQASSAVKPRQHSSVVSRCQMRAVNLTSQAKPVPRTNTNEHERTRTNTSEHERTRTNTNEHERTRTNTNESERAQSNANKHKHKRT